jgi:SAM-dependent methyltransferase
MSWTSAENEAFGLNRASWDERVPAHWASKMYSRHADELRAGGHCISQELVDAVGDVDGRALAHLQCHMGMETLSWSRLGADAVGLDFSAPAIERAQALRDELGLDTRFVQANVYDAPSELGVGKFDVVFVSVGALCWLPDVKRWAQVVSDLLRKGGRLVLDEGHPFAEVLEPISEEPRLEVKWPYFHKDGLAYDNDSSYVDGGAKFKSTRAVEWVHPLGEVVTSLIESGMVIESLRETARCCFQRYSIMDQTGEENWDLPKPLRGTLPMMYTLAAHKG